MLEQVILFLEGRQSYLLDKIKKDMEAAAEALKFEKAARLRDQFFSLQRLMEKQKAVTTDLRDRDIIALIEDAGNFAVGVSACVQGSFWGGTFSPQ